MTNYGRSEELVSRFIEGDLAEPESLASLGGATPGLVDGILSFPAANVSHCNEPITIDTMFSNEPALGSITQGGQIFIGHNSKYIDDYGVVTSCDLSHTLEENIMSCGAMDVLIRDNARKSKIFSICTVLNLVPGNLITKVKTLLNAVLGISKMS